MDGSNGTLVVTIFATTVVTVEVAAVRAFGRASIGDPHAECSCGSSAINEAKRQTTAAGGLVEQTSTEAGQPQPITIANTRIVARTPQNVPGKMVVPQFNRASSTVFLVLNQQIRTRDRAPHPNQWYRCPTAGEAFFGGFSLAFSEARQRRRDHKRRQTSTNG